MKHWHACWIREKNFPSLDLDDGNMGNRCHLYVSLSGQHKKGASYWRHDSTPLFDHMKYNTQCWDDPTIQHVMWVQSSELKSENSKGSGSDSLQVRNQVILNYEKLVCLRSHMWIHSMWGTVNPLNWFMLI